jgi:class 3 adenylate cyclase
MGSSISIGVFVAGAAVVMVSAVALAVHLRRRNRVRRLPRSVPFSGDAPYSGEGSEAPDRVLATVVFTDIVASTRQVAALGDRKWRHVLDHHDTVTREQLECHRGSEVRHTGDGFLATFDSPARAVECVEATMASLRPQGIRLRAGMHTGEVELRGRSIDGIAVHIGARVCDRAQPDEILVSQTVRDAAIGSTVEFTDRGVHELSGVPESWQLYAARKAS